MRGAAGRLGGGCGKTNHVCAIVALSGHGLEVCVDAGGAGRLLVWCDGEVAAGCLVVHMVSNVLPSGSGDVSGRVVGAS